MRRWLGIAAQVFVFLLVIDLVMKPEKAWL